MQKAVLSMVLAILAAGCELEPADYPPPPDWDQPDSVESARVEDFVLRTGRGRVVGAQITESHITGGDVSLGRYATPDDHAVRGSALGYIVNLDIEGDRVNGLIGSTPVDLTVRREGGALHARGLVRGFVSDFRLSEGRLVGTVGRCSYDLTHTGTAYEGTRSCRSPLEIVWLKLPLAFQSWSPAEQGAALSALLHR